MTRKFQFVAVVLAVMIVLGSVPVSARCVRSLQSKQKTEHCAPNCPMMMHASGAIQQDQTITSAPIRANCCNVSTSRPEATVQLPVPVGANVLPVPEVAQSVDLDFDALAESSTLCSFSAFGRFSSQVLRI